MAVAREGGGHFRIMMRPFAPLPLGKIAVPGSSTSVRCRLPRIFAVPARAQFFYVERGVAPAGRSVVDYVFMNGLSAKSASSCRSVQKLQKFPRGNLPGKNMLKNI